MQEKLHNGTGQRECGAPGDSSGLGCTWRVIVYGIIEQHRGGRGWIASSAGERPYLRNGGRAPSWGAEWLAW